ncbi:MAG: GNAT family N-acetyltransferase [Phycisphaerales bacterium JB040]
MTRCANERETPGTGHDWRPPEGLDTIRIETARLVVRVFELDDAPRVFEAVTASHDHLAPWMDWVEQYKTLDNAYDYVVRQRLRMKDLRESRAVGLGMFEKGSGRFVGGHGFHGLHLDTAAAEFGYWVRQDANGSGFATEASRHVVSYLLRPQAEGGLGLRRARAYCSSENIGSRRVLEKAGLPLEVCQRGDIFAKGLDRTTDRLGYGITADEWDCVGHRPLPGTPTTRLPA